MDFKIIKNANNSIQYYFDSGFKPAVINDTGNSNICFYFGNEYLTYPSIQFEISSAGFDPFTRQMMSLIQIRIRTNRS